MDFMGGRGQRERESGLSWDPLLSGMTSVVEPSLSTVLRLNSYLVRAFSAKRPLAFLCALLPRCFSLHWPTSDHASSLVNRFLALVSSVRGPQLEDLA